jgi:hypothetical protein
MGGKEGGTEVDEKDELRFIMTTVIDRLANDPHPTIAGLRRRYYYRGVFTLMEYLTPKGLAWNIKRLSRREPEHAARLAEAWNALHIERR